MEPEETTATDTPETEVNGNPLAMAREKLAAVEKKHLRWRQTGRAIEEELAIATAEYDAALALSTTPRSF